MTCEKNKRLEERYIWGKEGSGSWLDSPQKENVQDSEFSIDHAGKRMVTFLGASQSFSSDLMAKNIYD